ncbi:MAG TPA: SPOR domain-containing protein [Helicobacteraceae bacterium]|nr:SPOR domain-containing protein [Helicobacteraceae bacterium]
MKAMLIITIFLTSLGADAFTIQVLYAKNPSSLTPMLLKKIKTLHQPYAIEQNKAFCRVYVGTPSTKTSARKLLPRIQHGVTPDAFITKRSWNCAVKHSPCTVTTEATTTPQHAMTSKDSMSEALKYFKTSGYYHFKQ